jgi:hypothetical protein
MWAEQCAREEAVEQAKLEETIRSIMAGPVRDA